MKPLEEKWAAEEDCERLEYFEQLAADEKMASIGRRYTPYNCHPSNYDNSQSLIVIIVIKVTIVIIVMIVIIVIIVLKYKTLNA